MKFTDKDIDSLLASVEVQLKKAETLAKALPVDEEKVDAQPPVDAKAPVDAPPAPPAEDKMPADMPAPAGDQAAADVPPAADQGDVPPPAAEQAPQGDAQPGQEQALEGEAQGEEQPLSDEELDQIYGSLDPQELERHYMAIRRHLQGAYAKAEMESKDEEKKEDKEEKKDEDKKDEDKKEDMEKAEKLELTELKKKYAEQEQTLVNLTKAIEILAKPRRKAVTDIAFIQKSEEAKKPVSKAEIKSKLNVITRSAGLSKSERDVINDYCLFGTNENEVINIIQKNEQGGK
jgi:hypothetical protein